jgi:hypothetical protein
MRPAPVAACVACATQQDLVRVETGWLCRPCFARFKQGRDATTARARGTDAPRAVEASEPLPLTILTEPLQRHPTASADACAHREQLAVRFGNDVLAMAIDAERATGATTSLDAMLAHQLAVAHKAALEMTDKAFFEPQSLERCRMLNVAVRLMDSYQRGLLTLHRRQHGGQQTISVQHVHVGEGGQAIVGNLRHEGRTP